MKTFRREIHKKINLWETIPSSHICLGLPIEHIFKSSPLYSEIFLFEEAMR